MPPLIYIYIYICWRGGEAAKGVPQVEGILLGCLPIWPPPLPYPPEGEGKRREEGRKGEAKSPLSFSHPLIPSPVVPKLLSGDPISTRYPLEHFRCPNTIVLYINLYLSTISRLLVMSVISSGTPNNIRSPNHITHIYYIVIER